MVFDIVEYEVMTSENGNGVVGLVIVSHSAAIASGLAELVAQVAGPDVPIVTAGGGQNGTLGTDGGRVLAAMHAADVGSGAVILVDLGSSVLSVRAALAELPADAAAGFVLADAPLVEGAVAPGVAAAARAAPGQGAGGA